MVDTASLPVKKKFVNETENTRLTLTEKIWARKKREGDERMAREKAFDERLIGLGGTVALGVEMWCYLVWRKWRTELQKCWCQRNLVW
ncbi:hypothetical protein TB2_035209 [Malus domestica]